MLKATIIGNIGQDASLKTFGNTTFISFSVAHTDKYKDNHGVDHEKTQWVSCLKRIGENSTLAAYLKKGTKVYVEGRLTAKLFDSQASNTPQIALNLDVAHLELLSARMEPQQNTGQTARPEMSPESFGEPIRVPMNERIDEQSGLPF